MEWSKYQEAIFADVATGSGHQVVVARAGAGKTSTVMESLNRIPAGKSSLLVAFNKRIAKVLQQRAPRGVDVATLHSFGFRAVRRAFGNVELNNKKSRDICEHRWGGGVDHRSRIRALCKAVSMCKATLTDEVAGVDRIIDRFDIDAGATDRERELFCGDVLWLLEQAENQVGQIDFDDMIWLPVKLDLPAGGYDRVFVDELQDLTEAQTELVLRSSRRGGRICGVGDDLQAIYQWRGAASDAMGKFANRLEAAEFRMPITYRCGRRIVGAVNEVVPDLEAGPNNPEGKVGDATVAQMVERAEPGDFVLSRLNAPLIGNCLELIKAGKPANIAGRNIADGLVRLIDKSRATDCDQLNGWVADWARRERDRRLRRDHDADCQDLDDRVECIAALCEGETRVSVVRAKINKLFEDRVDEQTIMLSTAHRAKGLERDRVWMLADTFRRERGGGEANCWYVAATRAKHELWMVR